MDGLVENISRGQIAAVSSLVSQLSTKKRSAANSLSAVVYGTTVLHAAVRAPRGAGAELISLLLAAGAPPDMREPNTARTALHLALSRGELRSASALLQGGASLDAKDKDGLTPVDMASALLSKGAREASSGLCFAWGVGSNYQLGQTGAHLNKKKPTRVEELPAAVKSVCTSKMHTLVVGQDGKVWSSGFGVGGRLGIGSEEPQALFKEVGLGRVRVAMVACAENHSVAVAEKGDVYTWGSNRSGQLGHAGVGAEECQLTPRRLLELKGVAVVTCAATLEHTLLVDQSGSVYGFGSNRRGQLGFTIVDDCCFTPRRIQALAARHVTAVSASAEYSAVASRDSPAALYLLGHQGRPSPYRVSLPGTNALPVVCCHVT